VFPYRKLDIDLADDAGPALFVDSGHEASHEAECRRRPCVAQSTLGPPSRRSTDFAIESGCRDLNPGPQRPERCALTKLRHTPSGRWSVARQPSDQRSVM